MIVCTLSGVLITVVNKPSSVTVPVTPANRHEIADLHRPQHHQEGARGEVGQQARPGHADGDAGRRDQGGEGRRLDAEVAENADDQQNIQGHRDDRADVAQHGRVDLLALQRGAHHVHRDTDQPAADHPECDGREHLDADLGRRRHDEILPARNIFLVHLFSPSGWGTRRVLMRNRRGRRILEPFRKARQVPERHRGDADAARRQRFRVTFVDSPSGDSL